MKPKYFVLKEKKYNISTIKIIKREIEYFSTNVEIIFIMRL